MSNLVVPGVEIGFRGYCPGFVRKNMHAVSHSSQTDGRTDLACSLAGYALKGSCAISIKSHTRREMGWNGQASKLLCEVMDMHGIRFTFYSAQK